MKKFYTPPPLEVDAYQLSHFLQTPPGMDHFQLSQAMFRKPLHYGGDVGSDYRIVSAGVMPFVLLELANTVMTMDDVEETTEFLSDFHATVTPPTFRKEYPYPREMFERIVNEYGGKWPVCIMALRDGQTHYVGEPQLQIWTDEPGMGECVGWLESTMLPYLWTSATVATRGRIRKQWFYEFYRKCHPNMPAAEFLLDTKFHDFGRRGGAASQITGIAHLLNWLGTDTVDAAYAATKYLNGGKKFGANSIVAGAHRSVTPWNREKQAVNRAVAKFKGGIFAFVADSYDYLRCMRMLGGNAEAIQVEGGHLVGRPDSGDPVQCVVDGLQIFLACFGSNEVDGLQILKNAGVIQGDGVSDRKIFRDILPAVVKAGFSPLNVAFGMGEYNHRAVRSDLEAALKTSLVGQFDYGDEDIVPDSAWDVALDDVAAALMYHEVMKGSESRFKRSVPGPVSIDLGAANFRNRVKPISVEQLKAGDVGDYAVFYDGRRNPLEAVGQTFDEMRELANPTWDAYPDNVPDTFHPDIRRKQEEYMARVLAV